MVRTLKLSVLSGVDRKRVAVLPLDEAITLGTSSDNRLVLTDPAISRYHLELSTCEDGILLDDLGSRNGTRVGKLRVVRAIVHPGCTLEIGDSSIRLEDGEALELPTTPDEEALPGVIGQSPAMREVTHIVRRVAQVSTTVLIEGETGTGKELIAEAIHKLSPRRDQPFVVVDCGSLPATLVASELFGHEPGAFTGADQRRVGAFERANGGTIFLDEVRELPQAMQPTLLGALERRRFCRVGGSQDVNVDVRVVCATNRDLRREANCGTFRPDLYFRLAVARVKVPPLRERQQDIAALVEHFTAEITGSEEAIIGAKGLMRLADQRWTGNVRELRNVVECTIAIGRLALDARRETTPEDDSEAPFETYRSARAAVLAAFEKEYLGRLIRSERGNASSAARKARMDRSHLLDLLKRHGLR